MVLALGADGLVGAVAVDQYEPKARLFLQLRGLSSNATCSRDSSVWIVLPIVLVARLVGVVAAGHRQVFAAVVVAAAGTSKCESHDM